MWGEAILRWYRFLYYDSVPWTLRWTSSRDDSPEEYHRNLVRGEWLRGGLQGEDLNWLRIIESVGSRELCTRWFPIRRFGNMARSSSR